MQEKQYKDKTFICNHPFTFIEIQKNGECYPCCCGWTNNYSFGNIYKQSFDKVWNSERAKKFRESILDGTYKFCDLQRCTHYGKKFFEVTKEYNNIVEEYPLKVHLGTEDQCNVRCVMCRDVRKYTSLEDTNNLDSMIETKFLPLLKNCENLTTNVLGEALASKHSRKLLKRAIEVYPNIKIRLITNGLICNEKVLNEAGILDNLYSVTVSVHATTKKTYDKIVKDSNFDEVMKNIKWLAKLKEEKKLSYLCLVFVISQINYKEVIDFAKMCKNLNVRMEILKLYNFGTEMCKNFDKLAVFEKSHPEYNHFVKVMNEPILKEKFVEMPPEFRNLKPITFFERLKNNIFLCKINSFIHKLIVLIKFCFYQ